MCLLRYLFSNLLQNRAGTLKIVKNVKSTHVNKSGEKAIKYVNGMKLCNRRVFIVCKKFQRLEHSFLPNVFFILLHIISLLRITLQDCNAYDSNIWDVLMKLIEDNSAQQYAFLKMF
jgi:hypothetical protein